MKSGHIKDLIDHQGLAGLNSAERTEVENHVAECSECERQFNRVRAAELLLKARVGEVVEPSPFFSTRLMAAVRERRFESESQSLWGIWRMARSLVTGMAATVVLLGGLAFFSGGPQAGVTSGQIASATGDNTEHVLFQDGYQYVNYDPTNGQVYQTVLGPEDSADGDY